MDLNADKNTARKNLENFKKSIPKRKSIFGRNISVDSSNLSHIKDSIETFYESGILISPLLIDRDSITIYLEDIDIVKQLPLNFKPYAIMKAQLLEQTKKQYQTRRVLLPGVREENSRIMGIYDRMIAYYLLMGGDNPIEAFSKVEMSMKGHGVQPDIRNSNNEIWR